MPYFEICTDKKGSHVFKETFHEKKGSLKQTNRNITVEETEKTETEDSFTKALSLVATEKCERLLQSLKKRALWKEDKQRIKERSWTLKNMNVKKSNVEIRK